jgi:hypothetical protein
MYLSQGRLPNAKTVTIERSEAAKTEKSKMLGVVA